jgi:hypothetical protein
MRMGRTHPASHGTRIDPSTGQCFSHRGRTGSWSGSCWSRTTATGTLPSASHAAPASASRTDVGQARPVSTTLVINTAGSDKSPDGAAHAAIRVAEQHPRATGADPAALA